MDAAPLMDIVIDPGKEAKVVLVEQTFDSWWHQAVSLFATYPHVGVLLALMTLDIITGTLAGWVAGKMSSNVSFKGHARKGIIICILGAARLMEFIIPGAPFLLLGTLGFCAYEVWSIVENAGRAGVPMPPKLRRAFEVFREQEELKEARVVSQTILDVHAQHAEISGPQKVVVNDGDSVITKKKKQDSDIVIDTRNKQ